MMKDSLLVELLVEELPPKALPRLGAVFAETIVAVLREKGLLDDAAVPTPYATPRRLAVHLSNVLDKAPDRPLRQKLLPASVGLDGEGRPTPALLKKLAALGYGAEAAAGVVRASDGKTETLYLDTVAPGATLVEGLQAALSQAIAALPIPKTMSYQLADGWSTVHFVRPAHRLMALHGERVAPVSILGLQAGRETQGHRFAAHVNPIVIAHADGYARQLEAEGAVIASFAARREEIRRQLQAAAAREGLTVREDEALLDEVTALVEWPNVLACRFDAEFLAVPPECLILTMKANQKYFPLFHADGRLANVFLVVANIRPDDPSAVIRGNERVVRPRLADAKFFFDQDRKKSLLDRIPQLSRVVYHNRLGSQGERIGRLATIARAIGERLGGETLAAAADRAALLAKADLVTDMVGEFPELQGIMGRHYALHDGEPNAIAEAIEDHYKPRFAGDELPRGPVGVCVALADKLETLVGLFGIGEMPSGDKDPYALRRHAIGMLRILLEKSLPLPLDELLAEAFSAFPPAMLAETARGKLLAFLFERLAGLLREQGYSPREIDAVLALSPQRIDTVPARLAAVRDFSALPEAASLAAANKRVANILKKAQGDVSEEVDGTVLLAPAERALHEALLAVQPEAEAALSAGRYAEALRRLAALKEPVDAFFDQVMVNVEDQRLRSNRLALLSRLHAAMNRVADLARL